MLHHCFHSVLAKECISWNNQPFSLYGRAKACSDLNISIKVLQLISLILFGLLEKKCSPLRRLDSFIPPTKALEEHKQSLLFAVFPINVCIDQKLLLTTYKASQGLVRQSAAALIYLLLTGPPVLCTHRMPCHPPYLKLNSQEHSLGSFSLFFQYLSWTVRPSIISFTCGRAALKLINCEAEDGWSDGHCSRGGGAAQ